MSRWSEELPADLRSVLEEGRSVDDLPAATRARAVARARAVLNAWPQDRESVRSARGGFSLRWAAAVAIFSLAAVTGVAAAYQIGIRQQPAVQAVRAPVAPRAVARPDPVEQLEPAAPSAPPAPSPSDEARAERHLLKRARAEVSRGDAARALALLSEHARRFKNGRLVEEREALRVKALAGLGRIDDAQTAACDFQARFPRSPLLSAVITIADLRP